MSPELEQTILEFIPFVESFLKLILTGVAFLCITTVVRWILED